MTMTTSSISVRPVTENDDLDAVNLGNFAWWGEEQQRALFASGPAELRKAMVIAELDGEPVGYGHGGGGQIAAYGYGIGTIYVLPHARGRGFGRLLLDTLTA